MFLYDILEKYILLSCRMIIINNIYRYYLLISTDLLDYKNEIQKGELTDLMIIYMYVQTR